jgi:hypothetical protein
VHGDIFVERLWRSLKHEEVYLNVYPIAAEAKAGIGARLDFYKEEHQHQSFDYRTQSLKWRCRWGDVGIFPGLVEFLLRC